MVLGDMDNDGDLDALAHGSLPTGRVIRLLENNGDGTFIDVTSRFPAPPSSTFSLSFGDFDGDGRQDIAVRDFDLT